MRIAAALLTASLIAGCATTGGSYGRPAEVVRFHLDGPLDRGTVVIQPAEGGDVLSSQPFAAAVAHALDGVGYTAAPDGAIQFIAVVDVRRRGVDGPPARRSGLSIGIGAGGFSGGRHSGVGYGGGVAFPVGGGGGGRGARPEETELSVTIKRRVDQSPIWEGHARTVAGREAPTEAVAEKLAAALFTGFPGESGRTIEVR